MRTDWQTFLRSRGAELKDGRVMAFGDPPGERRAALAGDAIADLAPLGLIRATGADVSAFLQGQLTVDLRAISPQRSRLAAWCSAQGRVLAVMHTFRRADAVCLQLAEELVAPVSKRMQLYVLRADVRLENASDGLGCIGVTGENAARSLERILGQLPAAPEAVASHGELTLLRLRGAQPRIEVLGPFEELSALWDEVGAGKPCTPVGYDAWHLLDIDAGIPSVYAATADQFVPQMLNLHTLDAVSFDKGCYAGQEVVARTQYRGRLKRRMYLARTVTNAEHEQPPRPGAPVVAAAGERAGTVIDGAAAVDGSDHLLAVLRDEAVVAADLYLEQPDGPALELLSLPYAVAETPS